MGIGFVELVPVQLYLKKPLDRLNSLNAHAVV